MKKFAEPNIEIKKFSVEDVMSTSGGPNDKNVTEEDVFGN